MVGESAVYAEILALLQSWERFISEGGTLNAWRQRDARSGDGVEGGRDAGRSAQRRTAGLSLHRVDEPVGSIRRPPGRNRGRAVKTNAQRREVARLRLQAALLQQEADELRRQARRQARQGMTPGKVVAAFVAWVGIALGIVIGVSGPLQQRTAPLQPIRPPATAPHVSKPPVPTTTGPMTG